MIRYKIMNDNHSGKDGGRYTICILAHIFKYKAGEKNMWVLKIIRAVLENLL